ncbi:ACT domain-containing protein [Anaerohalosphaeraceae bacterium U12dextr]
MKLTQISVFLENRKGRLYEICSRLGQSGINIRALTIAETETFGVLRLIVDKPDAAVKMFQQNNITANRTDVVGVEVPDKPGGLADVLKVLTDADVNVEYMYGFMEKFSDKALMVFRFDDPEKAAAVLASAGVNVVTRKEIQGL